MTKREFLDTVFALAPNEANAIMDAFDEYVDSNEPHWIPVEQELPETDDEVLTTYIVNGNRKKRYVETSRYYYDGFSGYWSSPWDEYRIAGTRIEVIAWMPLPEPMSEQYKNKQSNCNKMPLPEPYKGVTDGND